MPGEWKRGRHFKFLLEINQIDLLTFSCSAQELFWHALDADREPGPALAIGARSPPVSGLLEIEVKYMQVRVN